MNNDSYRIDRLTFEWNGFMECIRILANEVDLSMNEFVKKMLIADDFSFQKWRAETQRIPEETGTNKQTSSRPWDSKKVITFFFYYS